MARHQDGNSSSPLSPYVTLGAVRYAVRRAPPPRACPCRCCSEEAVAACLGRSKADRRTLERFGRSLGRGGRDERPSRQKRLRDLTERLLRPHTTPPQTPTPPPPPPLPPPHSAPVLPPVPPPRSRHRHSPPRGVSVDRCDEFDANNITLVRVEPRSIIGSYAQKTIPYRSASFSQGDFAPEKYYKTTNRQPSIFDFGRKSGKTEVVSISESNREGESTSATEEIVTEGGSVASVDSAVGSDEGLLTNVSLTPRSPPPEGSHKPLSARSLTHPLPRRVPPVREEGESSGSLPALTAPRVLHEVREESDGSQADSAQAHSEGTSPLEPAQPFAFPPLPAPPSNACANVDCECANFSIVHEDSASSIAKSIPVPVYECIVKQWSNEIPQKDLQRCDAASDGSLDRDKEDETITSEQVATLLEAVKNPYTSVPIGGRERRRPLDKTKRRKGIYITTASDDGGEDETPPSFNGCKRENSGGSLQDACLSTETRTSSLLGDKSDDSCTNGPPSPSEGTMPTWSRIDDLKMRRARFSQQSSDERDEDSYRIRRKFGVTSRGDSASEAESDTCSRDRTASPSPYCPSDASDVEARRQQFARGPFGRNLEAPSTRCIESGRRSFSDATVPSRKTSIGAVAQTGIKPKGPTHVRATSSPSKLSGVKPTAELLAELLRGSSEALSHPGNFNNVLLSLQQHMINSDLLDDTRTHVVLELYETEKSYVESLEVLVKKYLQPLKSPEYSGLLEPQQVDEIFYQVPGLLSLHETFLEMLMTRLTAWDRDQKIGDLFLEVFKDPRVFDTYSSYILHLKKSKEAIKTASTRPAFVKFLDTNARDHKGKLSLDNLLIKPVQKFPSYKLLIQRLIKHTKADHPDHKLLEDAQRDIEELLCVINCTEKESDEQEQQLNTLKDIEQAVEGLSNLISPARAFIRYEIVSMPGPQGALKDRALFLFSDLLLITSFKRRTGTIKKCSNFLTTLGCTLDGNKYKQIMRLPLGDLEVVKASDEAINRMMTEIENLTQDANVLSRICQQISTLHCPHAQLDDIAREMLQSVNKLLAEKQSSDSQLCHLKISANTPSGPEMLTIIFSKPEKKSAWDDLVNDTKLKLGVTTAEKPAPEFITMVPIRKTRAGLQFTCAAATIPQKLQTPDVWVCNSDGYVGQVCVLSLTPEPHVVSCNGVCNSRILCIASVPGAASSSGQQTSDNPNASSVNTSSSIKPDINLDTDETYRNLIDSSSSSEDEDEASSSDNVDATSERSQESNATRLNYNTLVNLSSNKNTLTPSHCKSLSTPHTSQSSPVAHPVVKSNSNPTVDKQAMGISTGNMFCDCSSSHISVNEDSYFLSQPTIWVGCEDGNVHVYHSNDPRIKRNRIKLQHDTAVEAIMYVDNRVFVSVKSGIIVVYERCLDRSVVTMGNAGQSVSSMLLSAGRLWCAAHSEIKILNTQSLVIEETIPISTETKPIGGMAVAGDTIWITIANTAQLRCYNVHTKDMLADINLTQQIIKLLNARTRARIERGVSELYWAGLFTAQETFQEAKPFLLGCDDIIRQHKTACLRLTALLVHHDTLWVGTSAGLILIANLQRCYNTRTGTFVAPVFTGVVQGHTGNVRFLTRVDRPLPPSPPSPIRTQPTLKAKTNRRSGQGKYQLKSDITQNDMETLIISGGDGFEDLLKPCSAEEAGREDSTNHLLLWRV